MAPPVAEPRRRGGTGRSTTARTPRSDAVSVVVPVSATETEAVQVLVVLGGRAGLRRGSVLPPRPARRAARRSRADYRGRWLPVDVISTASVGNDLRAAGRKPALLDIDRFVLPELLPDVERVVVLPAASVVNADISELSALDLGGRLFAAPDPAGRSGVSGFGVLNAAANRLGARTAAATRVPTAGLRAASIRLRCLRHRRHGPRPSRMARPRPAHDLHLLRGGVRAHPPRAAAPRRRTGSSRPSVAVVRRPPEA